MQYIKPRFGRVRLRHLISEQDKLPSFSYSFLKVMKNKLVSGICTKKLPTVSACSAPSRVNFMHEPRVVIVSSDIPPRVGGIESFTLDFARACQRELSNAPTVLISPKSPRFMPNEGFDLIEIPSKYLKDRLPIINPIRFKTLRTLFEIRRSHDIAVLISHLFILNWLAALCFKGKIEIVWINQGANFVKHGNRIISMLIQFYERLGILILKFLSTRRVSCSESGSRWISKITNRYFETIPNCLEEDTINVKATTLREVPDKYELVFVGRLVPDKRPLESLEIMKLAVERLKSSIPLQSLSIKVVGDGPLMPQLKRIASQIEVKTEFLGNRARSEIPSLLHEGAILVQMPIQEGCPILTLEALASRVAIVTTPMDPCLNNLDEVYVGEKEDLADLICTALKFRRRGLHRTDTKRNIDHLLSHHCWSKSIIRFLNLEPDD